MSNLTIDQLFAPAPSGVTPGNPAASPSGGSWLATILSTANTVGLSTTAWQSGGMARTILAVLAVMESQSDAIVSQMAQAGFLQWAATGTVTYVAANGQTVTQPVTPDPSIPSQNPTGALGWLDQLCASTFNTLRQTPTNASGTVAIVNTSLATYTYAIGTYHIANALVATSPAPTYSNQEALSITPTSSTAITGESIGGSSVTLTANPAGFSNGQTVYVTGTGTTLDNLFWTVTSITATTVTVAAAGVTGTPAGGKLWNPGTYAFAADLAGPSSNAAIGSITAPVTVNPGVFTTNTTTFAGLAWESNTSLASRASLKLASLSPMGPAGAYVYFALSATQVLTAAAIQVPGAGAPVYVALTQGPIVQAIVQLDTTTGTVTVTIANADAATDGATDLPVTAATAASPVAITVTGSHNMVTGDFAYLSGIEGLAGATGYFQITKTGASTFTLNGSTGTGSYTSGGTAECGDLGMVDLILRTNALPDDNGLTTQWASTLSVTVAGTVYVPVAQVAAYTAALQTALVAYFSALPIGGITGVEASNVIPLDAIVGVLYAAGVTQVGGASSVRSVSGVTLNGVTADLSVGATQVPVLSGGIASVVIVGV